MHAASGNWGRRLHWLGADGHVVLDKNYEVLNLDKLTHAGNLASLCLLDNQPNYRHLQADIADFAAVKEAFASFAPYRVMHLAAASHVDRSITGAADFIQANIVGTFILLEAARHYWGALPAEQKEAFRFLHVSTDEVYGDAELHSNYH